MSAPILPIEIVNYILEMVPKEFLVANLTTYEYIVCEDRTLLKNLLRELIYPEYDTMGHWKKTDNIKDVPRHLEDYVRQNYHYLDMD